MLLTSHRAEYGKPCCSQLNSTAHQNHEHQLRSDPALPFHPVVTIHLISSQRIQFHPVKLCTKRFQRNMPYTYINCAPAYRCFHSRHIFFDETPSPPPSLPFPSLPFCVNLKQQHRPCEKQCCPLWKLHLTARNTVLPINTLLIKY